MFCKITAQPLQLDLISFLRACQIWTICVDECFGTKPTRSMSHWTLLFHFTCITFQLGQKNLITHLRCAVWCNLKCEYLLIESWWLLHTKFRMSGLGFSCFVFSTLKSKLEHFIAFERPNVKNGFVSGSQLDSLVFSNVLLSCKYIL